MEMEFPVHGLMPKQETEASNFVKKHATWDGRGIIVAILDTGVDPGAAGLQKTSDGKRKLLDVIDCCGSGDVVLSEPLKVDGEMKVEGLAGYRLRLNRQWNIKDGLVRVGLKRAFELYPKSLIKRLVEDRKKKTEVDHVSYCGKVLEEISEMKRKNSDLSKMNQEEIIRYNDLNTRLDILKELNKEEDVGPLIDVVVFNDGSRWRAAVDISGTGDFTNSKAYADYSLEHEYGTFSKDDCLNYSIKFYDNGNVLSIVTNAGSHGTHVAGIVGAYFEDNLELNGVAPGCQMISLKIGETRLGSMETGTGFSRAIKAIADYECDLVNISYGEAPNVPNKGHIVELLKELSLKKNVVIVSSAGNGGPALSTVGAPGGTSDTIIGVGAYVTPAMMKAEYALVDKINETSYTWSSRGPTADGDVGVSVYAPGAAITSVPTWTLQPNQLMNGTSMSSPNACGCLSLIISGLKHEKINYTPMSIKRAIENTSKAINDEFKVGLIQVEKSFEYLVKTRSFVDSDVDFQIEISETKGRGVYIRNCREANKVNQYTVNVNPVFRNDEDNNKKYQLDVKMAITSSEPWVTVPEYLQINNGGRNFNIIVDARNIKEGLNFCQVEGFDVSSPWRGPLFKVLITVCKPIQPKESNQFSCLFNNLKLKSGDIQRYFIECPLNCSYADIDLKAENVEKTTKFVIHTLQILPETRYSNSEDQFYVNIGPNEVFKKRIIVQPGVVMEATVAPFWSSGLTSEISFNVSFGGLSPNSKFILSQANNFAKFEMSSLNKSIASPSGSFDCYNKTLKPSEYSINVLSERDNLITGKAMNELVLTYKFKVANSCSITPSVPLFNDYLYDSPFNSVVSILFDKNKKYLTFGDIYPKKTKVDPGQYIFKLQLRHESFEFLESFSNLVLNVSFTLSKEVPIECYKSLPDLINKTKFGSATVKPEYPISLFIGTLVEDLNDEVQPGDFLSGSIYLEKKQDARPKPFPVQLYLSCPVKKADKSISMKPSDDKNEFDKLNESLLESKISALSKLSEDQFKEIISNLREKESSSPVFLLALLKRLDNAENRKNEPLKIVNAADKIISSIDASALTEHFGIKKQSFDKEFVKRNAEFNKLKDYLVESLVRKARSQISISVEEVSKTLKELGKWVDVAEHSDALVPFVWVERQNKRYGNAIKAINKCISAVKSKESSDLIPLEKELYELRLEVLEQLGWKALADNERRWNVLRFPKEFMGF
ncbi:subtilisin-like protein [Rozella allomycis CSF55]|uniref:tripeptidyl-peptidase II n=1 Tax=Rozella allomycis (strain CSF55) TaxID=988480 RepID=A0A075AMP2_ROZAC|nr:Peptidase S8/S53 domain-containing protein [Rozella allomycis CSF55]RKP20465.1 subtilisin-like protein [Rozella allomycis CSF55]|eukprot:EPZ30926.1 Peptidase S8/S53 domain-containing protein [Rozella allomycis CSF55]